MPATGVSRAQENRRIRQEALREQLAEQGHVQHVVENIAKLEDFNTDIDVHRLKAAIDARMKLIAKYLPDLKQTEIEGNLSGDFTHNLVQVEFIGSDQTPDS